jgi:hypothetical protein
MVFFIMFVFVATLDLDYLVYPLSNHTPRKKDSNQLMSRTFALASSQLNILDIAYLNIYRLCHYIKKTCHWLLTNLPNLEKTAQKHGIRLLNTLGISTNSSGNIMLHAILQTNTGYQITLNSHTHHYYYPQFFIGPKSICILSTFETQFDHKCNKLWS